MIMSLTIAAAIVEPPCQRHTEIEGPPTLYPVSKYNPMIIQPDIPPRTPCTGGYWPAPESVSTSHQAEPGVGAFKAPMSFALLRSPSCLFPGQIVGLVVDEVGLGM
jgi:hypothetical protein